MTLLADLADTRAKRSKSAHKLAVCVVHDPEAIVSMSTAALASLASVSEPTVNRFCTGLGFKGFPDFKLALAGELARKQPRIAQNIEPDDSTGLVAAKIFESTDQHRLDTPDMANSVISVRPFRYGNDRIAHELTGTMVGDLSATVTFHDLHSSGPQPLTVRQDIGAVGVATQRVDVAVLEQQQRIVCPT